MAREVRYFQATIPAGTPKTAPVVQPLTFPPRVVTMIRVVVPPGPSGLMGFAIAAANVNIIPYNPGEWIVTDDDKIDLPLDGYIDSGAWQISGYNMGNFDHTVYLTFELELVTDDSSSVSVVAANGDLSSS